MVNIKLVGPESKTKLSHLNPGDIFRMSENGTSTLMLMENMPSRYRVLDAYGIAQAYIYAGLNSNRLHFTNDDHAIVYLGTLEIAE